jgi:histidyl-tRNA synthetase
MKDAPLLLDYLDEQSKNDFDVVKNYLTKVGIPFEIDPALVRGLDYYTKTTFEIVSGSVGSQSALCGGGRYDLLVEELGGKATPGVGFAAGMERILLACENEKSLSLPTESIDVYLIRVDSKLEPELNLELELAVANISSLLRRENFSCDYDYLGRSVKAQMREANKYGAKYVVFVGGDEYKRGELNVKNLSNGEQQLIKIDDFEKLKSILKS